MTQKLNVDNVKHPISNREVIEYVICTKSKTGEYIVLVDKVFDNKLKALNEANKTLSLLITGNLLKEQTVDDVAYICNNLFVGKRVRLIQTFPIEAEIKV